MMGLTYKRENHRKFWSRLGAPWAPAVCSSWVVNTSCWPNEGCCQPLCSRRCKAALSDPSPCLWLLQSF